MKTVIALVLLVNLVGCAQAPQWLASMYDRNDPCQTGAYSQQRREELGRPVGYRAPDYCGTGSSRTFIYNSNYTRQGYIQK